uniref:Transmembrane protein n=1 Tax=Panagrellus redivivus TaxID=6233 RepID=A0A7E4VIN1_PANRE
MHFYTVLAIALCLYVCQANDVAKDVDDGVELLKTGSIDLFLPEKLSFTMRNVEQCIGYFRICYDPAPTFSFRELAHFENHARGCPINHCSLMFYPSKSSIGLTTTLRDGDFYGEFDDKNRTWCPRHAGNGHANFTVVNLPNCPVIINGATLANKDKIKPKNTKSIKWIVATCAFVGIVVAMGIVVGACLFIRSRYKPTEHVNPVSRIPPIQRNTTSAKSQTSNGSVHYTKSKIRRKLKELNIEPAKTKSGNSSTDDGRM